MGRKPLDLTGQKFERLTVVKPDGYDDCGHYMWLCKCECGNMKTISGRSLRSGLTRSCGCLLSDTMKANANNRRNNVLITYNGETHNIAEWAKILDIKYSTLYRRLHKGWSVEQALRR